MKFVPGVTSVKADPKGGGEPFPDPDDYLEPDDIDEGTEFMQQNACDDFFASAKDGESSLKGKKGRRS